MNDWLQKLLQELGSGVSDNIILKKYPQLKGSSETLNNLKGVSYLVNKKGTSLDDAFEAYPEVKSLYESVKPAKSVRPAEYAITPQKIEQAKKETAPKPVNPILS